MSRPAPSHRDAPSSASDTDSDAHMRSDSSSSSDSDSDSPRRIEIRRRKREYLRWLQRRRESILRERENVAQQHREEIEAQRRANELARIQAEWEDRCHCGLRYSLCTRAQRLARYPRPSEIYVPDPTRPRQQRRFVTGIDLTNSDEGVERVLEIKIKAGPDHEK